MGNPDFTWINTESQIFKIVNVKQVILRDCPELKVYITTLCLDLDYPLNF